MENPEDEGFRHEVPPWGSAVELRCGVPPWDSAVGFCLLSLSSKTTIHDNQAETM